MNDEQKALVDKWAGTIAMSDGQTVIYMMTSELINLCECAEQMEKDNHEMEALIKLMVADVCKWIVKGKALIKDTP